MSSNERVYPYCKYTKLQLHSKHTLHQVKSNHLPLSSWNWCNWCTEIKASWFQSTECYSSKQLCQAKRALHEQHLWELPLSEPCMSLTIADKKEKTCLEKLKRSGTAVYDVSSCFQQNPPLPLKHTEQMNSTKGTGQLASNPLSP